MVCAVCFLLSLSGGFARPFDVERWRLDVGCTGPSNPRLRPATLIQPALPSPASAAFCPRRRGHASGSPVIPRRVPEVDHEIPFICRAFSLLFGFLVFPSPPSFCYPSAATGFPTCAGHLRGCRLPAGGQRNRRTVRSWPRRSIGESGCCLEIAASHFCARPAPGHSLTRCHQ